VARAWGTTPDVLLDLSASDYQAMIDVLNDEIAERERAERRHRR